MSEER